MQRIFIYLLFFIIPISGANVVSKTPDIKENNNNVSECYQLYSDMQLQDLIEYKAFEEAYTGYKKIKDVKKSIITLIDFTKPSTQDRLFVLDLSTKKILYSSLVAHGKNSGEKYATSFSNENNSLQSSLGFYITENTYQGKNGYSLILNGLEKGINDHAKQRAIVVHGAAYSNPSVIKSGRLGRSFGCPAVPENLSRPIINTIKDGSLLFIYADNDNYRKKSTVLTM
ncbi:murein L,D-transpeptidase catalytic domain family protein [Dysgonomonas macrotermitis]|uniref:L,D-transpeptidase catalytic domain n=1 Tax=Dysgonomonas macrotermitis TaxID=1346286 RepID=A0A1M5BE53_9BACT|nr:murein L,D-transpeptidase catalytic domain family protein [Dysgonomonas macrotermitis]SHF40764.1 L,D-transpeptidase catalytic domain [Dysgonomonas macrotermitis]